MYTHLISYMPFQLWGWACMDLLPGLNGLEEGHIVVVIERWEAA